LDDGRSKKKPDTYYSVEIRLDNEKINYNPM
jgi:hypothetical protein